MYHYPPIPPEVRARHQTTPPTGLTLIATSDPATDYPTFWKNCLQGFQCAGWDPHEVLVVDQVTMKDWAQLVRECPIEGLKVVLYRGRTVPVGGTLAWGFPRLALLYAKQAFWVEGREIQLIKDRDRLFRP